MIAIVKGLPRFDGRAKFTTWAYRVATNACLDELRRRGRRPDPGLPDHERADDRLLGGMAGADPAETVTNRIQLDAALAELPEEFRTAVVLRDVAGLDYAEIASALDLAPGTVRSRIARGRRRLASTISEPAGNQTPSEQRPNYEP